MNDIETLAPQSLRPDRPTGHASRSVRIHRQAHGAEPTVHKTARGGERAALRREAEVLRAAGSTDLVRLVELIDGPDSTELITRDTGGPSLAAALVDPATSATEALTLLAGTCDAVSRLHHRGWGHGGLRPDHVLLSARGRIRLCSLGAAAPIDVDPGAAKADRVAVLRMVDDWCRRPVGSDRIPSLSTRARAWVLERRTHRLADDPDPQVLARILRRTARAGSVTDSAPARRTAAAIAAVSLLALAAASWLALRPSSTPDAVATATTTTLGAPTATLAATTTTTTTTLAPSDAAVDPASNPATSPASLPAPDQRCATVDATHPDVDGDSCGDEVSTEANTIVVGARRYRLGADGDVVAVGDWDCDGVATPALLRPSTGKVFAFDRWASESDPSTAEQIGTIDGATEFEPSDGRCGAPRVVASDGTAHSVDAAGTRP